jgi:hypothetical protein
VAGGFEEGKFRIPIAGLADTAGGVLSMANPAGRDIYVTRVILDIPTKSTVAAVIDGGIVANGTTSSDNLFDGLDVGTAAGTFDNIKNGGTNGKAGQKWGEGQFLTLSRVSGAVAGLVGEAIIEWVPL